MALARLLATILSGRVTTAAGLGRQEGGGQTDGVEGDAACVCHLLLCVSKNFPAWKVAFGR